MTWRVVGSDVNGRPTFSAAFAGSTAWGIVQEMHDRWAWELNMPDARDDQRGRAETRLEAQERVMTAARQRGLLEAERIAIETEAAAQLESLAALARADATLARSRRWDSLTGVDDAVEHAVAKERAAVVAWLRGNRACCEHPSYRVSCLSRLAADEIERGEHRREEEE